MVSRFTCIPTIITLGNTTRMIMTLITALIISALMSTLLEWKWEPMRAISSAGNTVITCKRRRLSAKGSTRPQFDHATRGDDETRQRSVMRTLVELEAKIRLDLVE